MQIGVNIDSTAALTITITMSEEDSQQYIVREHKASPDAPVYPIVYQNSGDLIDEQLNLVIHLRERNPNSNTEASPPPAIAAIRRLLPSSTVRLADCRDVVPGRAAQRTFAELERRGAVRLWMRPLQRELVRDLQVRERQWEVVRRRCRKEDERLERERREKLRMEKERARRWGELRREVERKGVWTRERMERETREVRALGGMRGGRMVPLRGLGVMPLEELGPQWDAERAN